MAQSFYIDREDAATKLIPFLEKYYGDHTTVVLGLPRGGVVLASTIAKVLALPLDTVIVKKINAPANEEFAIGAVTEDNEEFFDWTATEDICGSEKYIRDSTEQKYKEARALALQYRGIRSVENLSNKVAILVDDGISTGSTMRAAIRSTKKRGAKKVVVAVPVAPTEALLHIRNEVDEVVCPHTLGFFLSEENFYEYFPRVEDKEVSILLARANVTEQRL
ncbi:MAG: phosphoribosyltransferase family protein [Candidatus Paceibacterota bacterium]|jgi:predicted phosphoribosyltransferase